VVVIDPAAARAAAIPSAVQEAAAVVVVVVVFFCFCSIASKRATIQLTYHLWNRFLYSILLRIIARYLKITSSPLQSFLACFANLILPHKVIGKVYSPMQSNATKAVGSNNNNYRQPCKAAGTSTSRVLKEGRQRDGAGSRRQQVLSRRASPDLDGRA
jgi:hypothetical protein